MKKLLTLCCFTLLIALSGCSDAVTSLNDGNEPLISIKGNEITKNDVYKGLKNTNGATAIISKMTAFIVDKEVPVNDEIREKAEKSVADLKKSVGKENFENYIKMSGYENEKQFLEENAMLSARAAAITSKYISDNYDEVNEKYQVRKVQIFQTNDSQIASDVQNQVKAGELTIEEAVKKYKGVTTTYSGKDQIVTNTSGLSSDIWENIMKVEKDDTLLDTYQFTDDLSTFYVIKVVETKVSAEDATSTLEALTTIQNEAFAYYLDKYNFTVYDIDLYNAIQTIAPEYLVQDK